MIYGDLVHSLHADHPVELRYEDRPYKCNACLQIGSGARYTCAEPSSHCNFHLHKECAVHGDTAVHPFYPGHTFIFLVSPAAVDNPVRWCDACAENIEGYNYHCFDGDLDLHPACMSLDRTMMINEGKSTSTLRLCEKMKSKCHKCDEKKRPDERKSWGYSLSSGECCFHVACVKEMLIKRWEKDYLCVGRQPEGDASDEKAIVAVGEPRLQISMDGKSSGGGWGKLAKWKKIVKIALTFVMAAIVGDPTALVIGLFSQLLTR